MISKYTETFETYLSNTQSENEWRGLFSKFPTFVVNKGTSIEYSLDMWDVFKRRFDLREIGAETEQLFAHYLREKIDECMIKYIPKINMFIDNFNDLFKFTVTLKYHQEDNNDNKNTYYLNPVNNNTENLKVQDVDKSETGLERDVERDVLQSVWGKTRASILEQIMKLQSIYFECISEFEKCFMGIY